MGSSISPNGENIYVAIYYAKPDLMGLCAFSATGDLIWEKRLDRKIIDAPAIDNDGNLYILSITAYSRLETEEPNIILHCFSSQGNLVWEKVVSKLWTEMATSVSISKEGHLVFATSDNDLSCNTYASAVYCYNLNGVCIWKTRIEEDEFTAPILITADGYICCASTR